MAGLIEGYRWALAGGTSAAPIGAIAASVVITAVILILSLIYFRNVERTFADVI
jgi:lipopolysaccharide transport system permease protein